MMAKSVCAAISIHYAIRLRLFAALDLDDATRARLADVVRALSRAPGVKWAKPEALHVTLRFFGEWPEARLPELTDALERVERPAGPLEVPLLRLGFLPNEHAPRIFIAVGETSRELAAFQRRIEEAARDLGFEAENRAFLTHITLGRIRDPRQGRKLVEGARGYRGELGSFVADHWTLYRSETRPEGAVYTSLALWRFGGKPDDIS
jgi:2'-5' RNA ligase